MNDGFDANFDAARRLGGIQIAKFEKFWPADESMQDYYNRNPSAGYCQFIIDPKIQKLRQKFAAKLKN